MNKENIACLVRSIARLPRYCLSFLFVQKIDGLVLINEPHGWVISDISNTIKNLLSNKFKIYIDSLPFFYTNKIIHFGSFNSISKSKYRFIGLNNKIVVTIYHIDFFNDNHKSKIAFLKSIIDKIDKITVPNYFLYDWLINNGFIESKLLLIPIAYDESHFKCRHKERIKDTQSLKNKYNIPAEKLIIGSFQKDGSGWQGGMDPKYIKGPDVLVKVLIGIAKRYDICCLLTGPSRGYVISEFEKNNIDYVHIDASKDQLPNLYACLDVYLITSRIEGGPKGLMESMAIGVPVVSTRVGMSEDLIINHHNGIIVDVDDSDGLIKGLDQLLNNTLLVQKITKNASENISKYSWSVVIHQYESMYNELMACD